MSLLRADTNLLDETFELLRRCGEHRRECVVYWTGPADGDLADGVQHPDHQANALGYEVDTRWITRFFLELRQERRSAKMQIHTHPGPAGHSETDDRFSLVPAAGFLSLVIPNFAYGPVTLNDAFLAEMSRDGDWTQRSIAELELA